MGRTKLQHHLLLRSQVEFLEVATLIQVPDVQFATVLSRKQQLRIEAILHHIRGAPFGGDHGVVPEVPPEVVSQILRTTLLLPGALKLKRIRIHQEDAARTIASWLIRARCHKCRRGHNEWCVEMCSRSS